MSYLSPKSLICALLSDANYGVKVYDDSATPKLLDGHIYDRYVGKGEFSAHAWTIAVSEVTGSEAGIASLGSYSKLEWVHVQVDIWVMEKRGSTYSAEKTRDDLVQAVNDCLLHFANSPGYGYLHVDCTGWHDQDEYGIKRTIMDVVLLRERVRS